MVDARTLHAGLMDYHKALEKHVLLVREEYEHVSRSWQELDTCFTGNAADEFRPVWQNTSHNFEEYIEQTRTLAQTLSARIESLRLADASGNLQV